MKLLIITILLFLFIPNHFSLADDNCVHQQPENIETEQSDSTNGAVEGVIEEVQDHVNEIVQSELDEQVDQIMDQQNQSKEK